MEGEKKGGRGSKEGRETGKERDREKHVVEETGENGQDRD